MEHPDWLPAEISALRQVDVEQVDPNSLADINAIQVNPHLPREERIREFMRQIKNPYCFRCGKMVVKISFRDTDATLEDRIKSLLGMM
ncbi:MAG TPA: hypothetical protein GX499_00700 [Clostridiales bacterium]|nr:hypothetical protein [Clostridiales bacterium]